MRSMLPSTPLKTRTRGPISALLLMALAIAGLIAVAGQATDDTAGNPDYYAFDVGTTVSGSGGGEVYVVCVSPWSPFVFYNSTSNTLTGYEWDLFLAVSQAMGLSFTARVMGWNEMMNKLALDRSDPSHCDIAPTSIPVTPDLVPLVPGPKTVRFSMPTYHSGYSITTPVSWATFDRWSFGRVFTIELWAVLLGTAAVLALLTFAAELDYAKRGLGKTKYPTAFRPGMYEAVYNCVGKLFNVVQDLKVTSLAGKLISMGWGFLVLVASTTYTAGVTAGLTSLNFKTTISGVADLPHYRVVTWDAIVRNFLKYGFIPEGLPWLTETDGKVMLETVASGAADALVLDYPWLRYQLASRCDLALVGQPFHYVDNAVGFNPNLPASFINAYDEQLVALKQAGMYEEYQDKYLKASQCPSMAGQQMVVNFKQLEGLWIILGSFVALAIVLLILPHLSSRFDADIKRTRSMFDVRGLGKSFASLARRSFGGKDAGDDAGDASTGMGMPKGVELQDNPAFAADMNAKVVGFSSAHLGDEPPPSPRKVPEPSRVRLVAPGEEALDKDSVLPFGSSDAAAPSSLNAGPGADLDIWVGQSQHREGSGSGPPASSGGAVRPSSQSARLQSAPEAVARGSGSVISSMPGGGNEQAVHAALEELRLEEAMESLAKPHSVHRGPDEKL